MTDEKILAVVDGCFGCDYYGVNNHDWIKFARALLSASKPAVAEFKSVGRCECAFSLDECEVCEANREAYQEHMAEGAAPSPAQDERGAFTEWWDCEYGCTFDNIPGAVGGAFREVAQKAWNRRAALQAAPAQSDNAEEDAYVIKRLSTVLAEVAAALMGGDADGSAADVLAKLPEAAQTLKIEVELYRANATAAPAQSGEPEGTPVTFIGMNPLEIGKGATLPMIPDSWRYGFHKTADGLVFQTQDDGPLVAWDAVKDAVAHAGKPVADLAIRLTNPQFDALAEALDNPTQPNEALVSAMSNFRSRQTKVERESSAVVLDDERAAFEAALSKISPHRENGYDLTRSGPNLSGDDYFDEDIQTQWQVWQARAASPQPVAQTERALTDGERKLIACAADCISESVRWEQDGFDTPPMPATEWDYNADQLAYALRDLLAARPAAAHTLDKTKGE